VSVFKTEHTDDKYLPRLAAQHLLLSCRSGGVGAVDAPV
jgi:hypothetical protein